MQAISLSPSFSSYSNSKFPEIAARIVDEFESDEFSDEVYFKSRGGEDEEEFEFAIVAKDCELSFQTSSADEMFRNGKIRPVYPVFNRDLLLGHVEIQNENEKNNGVRDSVSPKIRLPLRKLFHEERVTPITTSSSSSTESDDLDGVTTESYCVWRPTGEDGRCKKSNSTGCDSKRWKLRDFLHRSHSDGSKKSFVVLSHSNTGREKEIKKKVAETRTDGGEVEPAASPHGHRDGGVKQRSYLPYREDLVGPFGTVNGLGKNLHPY